MVVLELLRLNLLLQAAAFDPGRYPQLHFEALSEVHVEQLHVEPPVWRLRGFLSKEDCQQLIEEGRSGLRPEKVYTKSRVLFDEKKTQPVAFVSPLLASGAYVFHDGDLFWTCGAFVAGLLSTILLRELVRWYVTEVASANGRGGARFRGLKWQLGPLLPGETETEGARARLLDRAQALCAVPDRQFLEPPFLTCYRQGDGQSLHVDSKELPNDKWSPQDKANFEASGGQRMVQCLVYLNDVAPEHGGATAFHHEAMASRARQEDLSQNRFLKALRASYEGGIYRQAAERGERTVILVPCAECLEAEHFGQSFLETHLLQASAMPNCYMNLLGQGVEIKESSVTTQLGFQEHRICEVLQNDSMYDLSNTFKVLVIDKPLIGRFRPLAAEKIGAESGSLDDLLLHSPAIQGEFFDEVDRFRKTFVQVPGCENRTAERIREIVTDAVDKLSRQHQLNATRAAQLEFAARKAQNGPRHHAFNIGGRSQLAIFFTAAGPCSTFIPDVHKMKFESRHMSLDFSCSETRIEASHNH
ncbi:unnamed protein product [Durusdinium trenchii]|uniref:Uncharacterized protein n=1 Tax=Durusdinium trenchii TaxID=1381693 RepID=A0ABP0LC74_9DINO